MPPDQIIGAPSFSPPAAITFACASDWIDALMPIGLPIVVSLTVSRGDAGLQTPTGVPLGRMVRVVTKHQPFAVGLNCSIDAERMTPAIAALATQTNLPLLAKPQAKESAKCLTPRNPETTSWFTQHAMELSQAGATAIGGCCGVGPMAITALRRAIDAAWPERVAS